MKKSLVLTLAVIVIGTGFVHAQIISVPNSSFQTPAGTFTGSYDIVGTTTTTGSADAISGWNVTTNETKGYGFVLNSSLTSPGTSDGSQAAYLQVYNGANFETLSTSASLGTIAANTKYTLTVAVGAPATWTGAPIASGTKTAGETGAEAILSLTGNGTSFASDTIAENVVPEGTLSDYTVTFTTGASGGDIGKALGISLEALKVNYPSGDPGLEADIFDNVRLTAVSTVPEPRTWALMLGSLGGLVFLARRNFLKS